MEFVERGGQKLEISINFVIEHSKNCLAPHSYKITHLYKDLRNKIRQLICVYKMPTAGTVFTLGCPLLQFWFLGFH